MQIGKIQTLQISRFSDFGAYLNAGEEEILLPNKFVQDDFKINDSIKVFLYTDSLDRPVATTQSPLGVLGDILALKIISIQNNGCFLDLGIDKDIFMPSKNPQRFQVGQNVVVRITTDKQQRLIAKLGIKEHLLSFKGEARFKQVEILPFETTPLGIGCVVNGRYFGLVYKNQIFSPLPLGEKTIAYIQNVRPDGKLDLVLHSPTNKQDEKNRLLKIIAHRGVLELDFDSSPQEIQEICQMSKKTFKTLVNALVKESKIKVLDSTQRSKAKCIHIV